MAHIVSFASGKGGVGKTLLCASLGIALARKGKKVLLIDGDMGMRNMDLVLGLENDCFYHIIDFSEGKCFAKDVILEAADHLDFLPAAPNGNWEDIIPAAMDTVLEDVEQQYDYIFLDCPAGVGGGIQYAANVSEKLILVVAPSWASRRNASQLMDWVGRKTECTLLLNQFAKNDETKISFDEMMETVDPDYFCGMVPYAEEADRLAHQGMLQEYEENGAFGKALSLVLRVLLEDKTFPDTRWNHLLDLAEKERKEKSPEKTRERGLSWNSSSPCYRWRRRR